MRRICQNSPMIKTTTLLVLSALLTFLGACNYEESETAGILRTGTIENTSLDEASGLQSSGLNPGVYFLHNDDGHPRIFAMDSKGGDLGSFIVEGAKNRDWEDLSRAPSENGPLLVVADTGDNHARHDFVTLYFVREPEPGEHGRYSGAYPALHAIILRYPGGPRDCESVAYDPFSGRIYLLSKRDKPSRIYSISLSDALTNNEALLRFDGEVFPFRRPTNADRLSFGPREAQWISQPTGLDFSPDGTRAAVISYRSLYLFSRRQGETWERAFARKPVEFIGPGSRKEESVSFMSDGHSILVTTEGIPAPVYRFRLLDEDE